jgi:hypothetical protein
VEELTAQVAALREFRASIAKGFGLGDDAEDAAILSAVGTTTKERDDSRAEAAKVKGERDADKVDAALRDAFAKSGADPRNAEDFLALARPLFGVDAKTGAVATKADAPNTVPGANAEAWIVSELYAKRAHWWPKSVGGGARGAGTTAHTSADDSMFDPASRNYNFTAQLAAEAKYGPEFADKARARYRGRGGAGW